MSDLPLVPGSIRGRRFFSFTHDGHLRAPIQRMTWNVGGENVAFCSYYQDEGVHPLESCECGFYATLGPLDVENKDKWGLPAEYTWAEVVAIIEGYGETLIGKKGFRCTKARILGIAPSPKAAMKLSRLGKLLFPEHYTGSERSYRFRDLREAFPEVPVFKTAEKLFEAFPVTDVKTMT